MNIEEYKFSDPTVEAFKDGGGLYFYIKCEVADLNKRDVIALAKHFKLTADDIKE